MKKMWLGIAVTLLCLVVTSVALATDYSTAAIDALCEKYGLEDGKYWVGWSSGKILSHGYPYPSSGFTATDLPDEYVRKRYEKKRVCTYTTNYRSYGKEATPTGLGEGYYGYRSVCGNYVECAGFSVQLGYWLCGKNPDAAWKQYKTLDSVKAIGGLHVGDIIRVYYKSGGQHWGLVYSISDTGIVKVIECHGGVNNLIKVNGYFGMDSYNKTIDAIFSNPNYNKDKITIYHDPANTGVGDKYKYDVQYYERAIYKGDGSNDNYVKEYPYSGSDVANLEENYKDKEFVVTCAVKNKHGNIWYKVEGGGFIYSGDVTYVSSCPTFKISGEQSPSGSLTKGNPFYNKAVIESSDSLVKVTSAIYQGNTIVQGPYVANISSSVQKSYTINASSDLAKKLTFGSLENGNYTYKVTVWYGKHGLSKNVISKDFSIGSGATVEMRTLDLSAHKDGVEQLTLEGVGTVDVYINGKLVADDVTDYSAKHPIGTNYEITDIKAINNFEYYGAYVGPLSGTIGQYDVDLVLMFEPVYPLVSVSAVVDGVATDSLEGIATFDVIVNKKTQGDNITSYAERWAPGYAYSITDVHATIGYEYNGCTSGNMSGTTGESNSQVVLIFESNVLDIAWTYADYLPDNISSDDYDIQYQNVYYRDQTTSPGSEWSLLGSIGTEYVDSGDVYTSFYQLETSETRVLNKFDYYHICGSSTGNGIWFEHKNSYNHTDRILDSSTVYVAGTYSSDADPNLKYYKLKWNDGSLAYCGNGTCSTTHAKRSCYWYRRYYYQDKVAIVTNRYIKYGVWQDSIDLTANDYQVRYRPKNGIITSINLPQIVYELKVGEETTLHFGSYSSEGYVEEPTFYWSVDNSRIARITQSGIKGYEPGVTFLNCTAEEKYGGCSAIAMVVVSCNESFSFPSKVNYISEDAFKGIPIKTVDFRGTNVEAIASGAFANCTNLQSVFFPDTLQNIANGAFDGCTNIVFICESYNVAAQYAEQNNIPFYCLDYDTSLMN